VVLPAQASGLPKDSIAVASQVMTVDRAILTERVSRLSKANLNLVLAEIDVVLGR
jgi:mRNA-degrading endonuclease toxin of MazEF toxin-antitoxin module